MLKIDLGCGRKARDGFMGVDIDASLKPEICADIRRPIPGLNAGCADEIFCSHVLEHIPDNGFHATLMEIARLLRPGGIFEIRVPHPSSDCAMVQGHIHVCTPRWWQQMKDDDWFRGKLVIDTITEVPDPQAVTDGMFEGHDAPPAKLRRYLRNMYAETMITGHRL